jgi:hypothetical protein
MSMSKVSKYNNHNNNVTGKLPLIIESVAVTRIDIHPTGEEPDQHAIRLTPRGSHI